MTLPAGAHPRPLDRDVVSFRGRSIATMRSFAPLFVILLTAAIAPAQPLLTAYRVATPPVIDGDLTDTCWREAAVGSPFVLATERALPKAQTAVRACWDAQRLHLGIQVEKPMLDPALNMLDQVLARQTGRDADIFSDECIEIFLQPTAERYYHLAINSIGTLYDAQNSGEPWDGDCEVAAVRGDRAYTIELAITFASMGAAPQGVWRVNFARERTAVRELSTWSGLTGAFHQPGAFGELRFAASGPAVSATRVDVAEGQVIISARFDAGAEDSVLRGTVLAGDTRIEDEAPAGATLRIAPPPAAVQSGRVEAIYEIAHGDAVVLRSAALPLSIAAGIADLAVATADARAEVYRNGETVEAGTLELEPGLNVIAIHATARGNAPSVRPTVSAAGRILPVAWLLRTDTPPEGWRTAIHAEGWETVSPEELRWPAGARAVYLSCALYVSDPGPALFPKMATCYFPRGSSQLMRFYVRAPLEVPADGYRMVVEAPAALQRSAVEPISGTAPVANAGGSFDLAGTPMARHRLDYEVPPGEGMELSIRWGDAHNASIGYQTALSSGGTHDWKRLTATIVAPEGAMSAHPLIIKWQNRGITGTFWVDNLVFRAADSDENLLKMGTFDEPEWGSNSRLVPEGPDGSMCCKIVSTPATANNQQALWVDKEEPVAVEPGREYVVEMDVRCEGLGSPTSRPLCGLLFAAPEELTEGELPVATYFQSLGGVITELPRMATATILPPLRDVRPARARIAPCYYASMFTAPEVARAYADNCRRSGITWTYGKYQNDVVEHLAPLGHQVILSIGWDGWNPVGAEMNDFSAAHPEFHAVNFEGKEEKNFFCPTWFLSEDAAPVRAMLERWLLDSVNSAPYAGADWDLEQPVVDPPTFCTCARCLSAFREFAGPAADTPLTPELLLTEYRDRWVDFRCTQNAEMAGVLKAIFARAQRPVEFSVYSGFQSRRTMEHYGVDWSKLAPHLDLAIAGYGGTAETVAATVAVLGETPLMGGEMWYLSPRDDANAAPRMATWRNRLLRKFVESGCVGVLIWYLPTMEGGAFYGTSEAAEIIARYEDWFRPEARCDERVRVEGIPARDWAAFERDGRVLVLLLSFADEITPVTVTVDGAARPIKLGAHAAEVLIVE